MSDDAFSALVDQKLARQVAPDTKSPVVASSTSSQLGGRTDTSGLASTAVQDARSGPPRSKPEQGADPARRSDVASDGAADPAPQPSAAAKPEPVGKRLDASADKTAPVKDATAEKVDTALPTETPQPAPATNDIQLGFNAPVSTPPLSVSASGVEKALGDSTSTSKASTSNRGVGTTSPTGAALIKTSALDPTAVATDLSEAVQAISGRARSDGDADPEADAEASAKTSTDLQLGAAAQDSAPKTLQPDGAIAAPLTAPPGTSGVRPAEAPSRTVSSLSAQIIGKLGEQSTRFDVALDPAGLGRVNVSVEINAKGEMSARLSFEHPEAAAALSRESGALRQALHDAGFQMKPEDLSFQSDGGFSDRGAASQWDDGSRSGGRSNPFGAMTSLADAADLSAMNAAAGRTAAGGLDIRI